MVKRLKFFVKNYNLHILQSHQRTCMWMAIQYQKQQHEEIIFIKDMKRVKTPKEDSRYPILVHVSENSGTKVHSRLAI